MSPHLLHKINYNSQHLQLIVWLNLSLKAALFDCVNPPLSLVPARINQTDVILNLNIVKPSASVRMQALLAVQPPSPRSSTIHHPRPSPSYGHSLYFISFLGLCLHQVKRLFLYHRSVFIKVVRYLVPLRAFCSHYPDSLSCFSDSLRRWFHRICSTAT